MLRAISGVKHARAYDRLARCELKLFRLGPASGRAACLRTIAFMAAAAPAASAEEVPPNVLQDALRESLAGVDLSSVSVGQIRATLEQKFGLGPGSLDCRRAEIRELTEAVVREMQEANGDTVGVHHLHRGVPRVPF